MSFVFRGLCVSFSFRYLVELRLYQSFKNATTSILSLESFHEIGLLVFFFLELMWNSIRSPCGVVRDRAAFFKSKNGPKIRFVGFIGS